MLQKTLSIIKPDAVQRGLIGEIVSRLEKTGFKISAMKMIRMTREQAKGFYKVHENKPFYESVTKFMSSGPSVVLILEGDDVINRYRQLMGATNYQEAEIGTIRRDFATDIEKNAVHGSDSIQTAFSEIHFFFNELEIHD